MKNFIVPASISARHVHLSTNDRIALFGETPLEKLKDLSQPGEYATTATVSVLTDGGRIDRIRVLGPDRPNTQVEISVTDARSLRIDPPVRLSGDLNNTPGATLEADNGNSVSIDQGVIIAARHLHLPTPEATKHSLKDGDTVSATIDTPRGGRLDYITVRVSDNFATDLHIDTDEANALGMTPDTTAEILLA
jgi:putative phosphotransacetylase